MEIKIVLSLLLLFEFSHAYQEQCIDGYCFLTPGTDLTLTVDVAKGWCLGRSAEMIGITEGPAHSALTRFLDSSGLESVFADIRLSQSLASTWFLVDGNRYYGGIGNQEGTSKDFYNLYTYLNFSGNSSFHCSAEKPNVTKSFVCSYEAAQCVGGTVSSSSHLENGRCYVKYDDSSLTWFQAREFCVAKEGDLATFNYPNDSYAVRLEPPLNTYWLDRSRSYWVGIRWMNWQWISPSDGGAEVVRFNWSSKEPHNISSECVCLSRNGDPAWSWNDCDCKVKRTFVCTNVSGLTNVSTVSPTTPESLQCSTTPDGLKLMTLIVGLVVGVSLLLVIVILVAVIVKQRQRLRAKERQSAGQQSSTSSNSYQMNIKQDLKDQTISDRGHDLKQTDYQTLDHSNAGESRVYVPLKRNQ